MILSIAAIRVKYMTPEARYLRAINDLDSAADLLQQEVARGNNLVPNLGLLAEVRIGQHDGALLESPATAAIYLSQAEQAAERCRDLDPGSARLLETDRKLADRRTARSGGDQG